MEKKKKIAEKAKRTDLRDKLGGRVLPEGFRRDTEVSEPAGPGIVSPGLKEPAGQTTHE